MVCPYCKKSTQQPNLLLQYITVYTPNSVHLNQITPSTPTTISWPHSFEILCSSSYGRIYQAVPVWTWGPFRARQGPSFHTTLKPRAQRRLCPPLFVHSFWPRPVRTRPDRIGCRAREEVWGGVTIKETAGMLWWYRRPLWQVLPTSLTHIVHWSALQYIIAFTYQGEKEIKKQGCPLTKVMFH